MRSRILMLRITKASSGPANHMFFKMHCFGWSLSGIPGWPLRLTLTGKSAPIIRYSVSGKMIGKNNPFLIVENTENSVL